MLTIRWLASKERESQLLDANIVPYSLPKRDVAAAALRMAVLEAVVTVAVVVPVARYLDANVLPLVVAMAAVLDHPNVVVVEEEEAAEAAAAAADVVEAVVEDVAVTVAVIVVEDAVEDVEEDEVGEHNVVVGMWIVVTQVLKYLF